MKKGQKHTVQARKAISKAMLARWRHKSTTHHTRPSTPSGLPEPTNLPLDYLARCARELARRANLIDQEMSK